MSDEQRRLMLANVERVVQMRNDESRKQRLAFEADGWKVTRGGTPPDAKLVGFDPALLTNGRERELRYQISSTTAHKEDAKNLAAIAVAAKEPDTRYHAVDALYRIAGDGGQPELYDLLSTGAMPAGDARAEIAPRLQPQNLEDPYAGQVAALLDNPNVTALEKEQIATTLAIIALRDGTMLDDKTNATLSPQARALIAKQTVFVTTELPKAWAGVHQDTGH